METKVSNKSWESFKDSDYTDEQFKRATLLPGETKSDSKFPVREPDGTLSRAGVYAAASRLNQASISNEDKAKLKKKLRSLYSQIGEDPPDSLKESKDSAYQLPADELAAVELGSSLMRKQIIPLRNISYQGGELAFDREKVQKIAENFKRKPFEFVPFVVSGTHSDDPTATGGEVVGMEATDSGLDALISLNAAGKQAVERNDNRLPVSVRFLEHYSRESDGEDFGPVVAHVASTFAPRMTGMSGWQPVEASEDSEVVDLTAEHYEESSLSAEDEALIAEVESEIEDEETEADNGEIESPDDNEEEEEDMAKEGDKVSFKRGGETWSGEFKRMDGENAVVEVDGEEVKVPASMLKGGSSSSDGEKKEGDNDMSAELSEYQSKVADLEAKLNRYAESDRRNTLELRRQKVERELEDYGRAGVPAADLDSARPLLMDDEASGELTYTDLSEDGASEKKSARGDLVRRMLDGRKGTVELGEKGDASAQLSEDDARMKKIKDYAKENELSFGEAARHVM